MAAASTSTTEACRCTDVNLSGNNSRTYAGGVGSDAYGTLTMTNVTISGNTAYRGGGLYSLIFVCSPR